MADNSYDLVVVGGDPSGCEAAYTARRKGLSVAQILQTQHIGGMQGGSLGATDVAGPSSVGGNVLEFYQRIGEWYGTTRYFHFGPNVAELIYVRMANEAGVVIYRGLQVVKVVATPDQLQKIVCYPIIKGVVDLRSPTVFTAKAFICASYQMWLGKAAGLPYRVGREAASAAEPQAGFAPNPIVTSVPARLSNGQLRADVMANPGLSPGVANPYVQCGAFRLMASDHPDNMRSWASVDKLLDPTLPWGVYDPEAYKPLAQTIGRGRRNYGGVEAGKGSLNDDSFVLDADGVPLHCKLPTASPAEEYRIIQTIKNYQIGRYKFDATDPSMAGTAVQDSLTGIGLPKDEFIGEFGWSWQFYMREGPRLEARYMMTMADVSGLASNPPGNLRKAKAAWWGRYPMDKHFATQYEGSTGMVVREGGLGTPYNKTAPYQADIRIFQPKTGPKNILVAGAPGWTSNAWGAGRTEPELQKGGVVCGMWAALMVLMGLTDLDAVPYETLRAELLAIGHRIDPDASIVNIKTDYPAIGSPPHGGVD